MATTPKISEAITGAVDKITGRGKSKGEKDQAELIAKCNRLYSSAQNARKLLDWKWFIYDLWVSGNHYAKYDRNSQQIVTTVRDDGKPKIVINKVYIVLRAVRNYTLRNKPKAEVTPANLTPDNIDQTIKLNRYLDYLHDRLDLRRKLKESTWHALKYSVGFWQVLWDEDGEDGVGEIEVNEVDPYDLYWDPLAKHPGEARFVCLAVRRNLADLKEDPKYAKYKDKLDDVEADKQMAASSMKSRMLQFESGSTTTWSKDEGSVIVKEFWMKETQKDTGKPKIRIVTLVGEECIRNELTELDRLPFFRLPSDIEPMSMYGQGWAKNIIPVNRLLDRLESQLAEYNDIMNKGKWIADKGAGVHVINNENGQIIEKKRGFDVHQEPIAPPSNVLVQQIQNANRYIEDMGSMHDAIQGRIPPGVESGNAIEALQQGDSNNLSEITENLEQFLEEVYEYILFLAASKYQFARNITPIDNTGQREFISVIGEGATTLQDGQTPPDGVTVITKKNMVDVKITSWLASTPQARQNAVKDLAQVMLANQTPLDTQTILEAYETGNIADIVQRIQQQAAQKAQQEAAMQQQQAQTEVQAKVAAQPPPPAPPPPPPPPPSAGQAQAIAALRAIINGRAPIIPNNVSTEFIQTIDEFLHTPQAKQLDPQVLDHIQAFRDHVIQQANGIGGGISDNQTGKASTSPNFFVQ